ncbi:hypothetical protein KC19_VG222400 [Ceratodon purpureus]|uniref:Uncharacterized protein n=1 Tax=Ceratodon purpureus TaxID=3225 RepID=A0A8T0HT46_CERPU|nr:hypothetical protein KC19_VG222400 [Ceratodon purpureus]
MMLVLRSAVLFMISGRCSGRHDWCRLPSAWSTTIVWCLVWLQVIPSISHSKIWSL